MFNVGEDGREENNVLSGTTFELWDLTDATIYNVTITAIAGSYFGSIQLNRYIVLSYPCNCNLQLADEGN